MDKPYLPVQFDELKLIKKEDFLLYLRIKTVGKIFGNALPRKGLKKKPKLQKEDKIGLIDVQKYKLSQPIAYWKDSLIVLDFDLVPDMPRTLYNASTVQVLGEISEIQNNFLYMTVHFVRDFSTINVDRYLEAIGKRSIQDVLDIQYPNTFLRRQMIDTILSPSSCALLSNAPLHQSYISEKDFAIPMNISKDLCEDSDEIPFAAEKEVVAPSSGKIGKDDFAAHSWLKDLTSEDIYDQIEPEIFKNSYVTAPQKVDFGTQKIKLKNFSANAVETLMEKKNRRINTKNTFKTMANSNFLKHSQDDPKTLPQFAPNKLKRDYGNEVEQNASIMKIHKRNIPFVICSLLNYSIEHNYIITINYNHPNPEFELKMKETTSLKNQETSSNLEKDDSLHDFLNLRSTKNWIDKCHFRNKPASFVYTPELLENIWISKFLLLRPKSYNHIDGSYSFNNFCWNPTPPTGQPTQLPTGSVTYTAAWPQKPQQSGLYLTRKQMFQAQEIFKTADIVTNPEKALILGFMAGSRENPAPQLGNCVTIKLSENQESVLQNDGTHLIMIVEIHFEMNYSSGEWKTIKKFIRLEDSKQTHIKNTNTITIIKKYID